MAPEEVCSRVEALVFLIFVEDHNELVALSIWASQLDVKDLSAFVEILRELFGRGMGWRWDRLDRKRGVLWDAQHCWR